MTLTTSEPNLTLAPEAANAYWNVVLECLVCFHHWSEAKAQQQVRALRQKADSRPSLYQTEPFYAACELAGRQIGLSAHREQYTRLLRKHGW